MSQYFSLNRFPLDNKTVLLRVDYNVPLENGRVKDNSRIRATLPTLRFLLQKNCKIVLATHLGRPEGKFVAGLKTDPLAKELQKLLPKIKIRQLDDCIGEKIREKIRQAPARQILLLENLRFYSEEEKNDPFLAQSLARLAEVYVNDAFAVCHRRNASIEAITRFLPAVAGLQLEKEIHYLTRALHPSRPAVWVLGGAKLDKIGLIGQALQKADRILIGGALSFAFLQAKNIPVGMSKTDPSLIKEAAKILQKRAARKIILPLDFVVAEKFSSRSPAKIVPYNQIPPGQMALDLGPQTIRLFSSYLQKAKTIIWNGPLGYFEWFRFATATREIGRLIAKLNAVSIVGGGETAEAIRKFGLEHKLTHLSTGGGAAIEFLSGKKLPGIEALERNYRIFRKKRWVSKPL